MLNIKKLVFNPLCVNTYVLYDDAGNAAILDPGMTVGEEYDQLTAFIEESGLKVCCIANTHPHIDHVLGNAWCRSTFNAPLLMHEAGLPVYAKAYAYGVAFGFPSSPEQFPKPDGFFTEGELLTFGEQSLQIIYTPGHCAGSVCFYDPEAKALFSGDLLFAGSVGRSDLPTGDANEVTRSLKEKIMLLPDDTVVYPGHGPATTIGKERVRNPFIS